MSGTVSPIPTTWTKPLAGFRFVVVQPNDNLQKIAARELGDASRWPDLANINGLLPPWISNDPGEASATCLIPGNQIKVPAPAPVASAVADPASVFGADVLLADGEFAADVGGDIAIVAGIGNLEQAINHRIVTRPGELVFHLDYGCKIGSLLGRRGGPGTSNALLASAFVTEALMADARIASVPSANASLAGDTITVSPVAETVDGKSVPVGTVNVSN